MLVLTRKVDEQIRIGNDIVITIVRLRSSAVGIGIQAPKNVRVLRAELGAKDEVVVEKSEPSQDYQTVVLKSSMVAPIEAVDESTTSTIEPIACEIFAPIELNMLENDDSVDGCPKTISGDLRTWRLARRQTVRDTAVAK